MRTIRSSFLRTSGLILFSMYILQKLTFEYGSMRGLQSALLGWSFFVLCTPLARGTIIFSPLTLMLGEKFNHYHRELLCWSSALFLNGLSLFFTPNAYYRTAATHLLYIIFFTKEMWTVILVNAATRLYLTLFATSKLWQHIILRYIFICTSLLTTFILTYNHIIIILNSHGTP